MRINQTEIARRLKLSTATVSKSLRNHPDINPTTRARVLDLAAQLDYQVRHDSRVDNRKNTGIRFVGVMAYGGIPDTPADHAALRYMAGLSEAAESNRVSLVVHHVFGDSRKLLDEASQPAAMRQGILEGLILIHRFDAEVVRELSNRMPCVTLVHYVPGTRLDHVDADCLGAMTLAAGHLHSLGHRRIGFFGFQKQISHSLVRYAAYATTMLGMGLPFEEAVESGGENLHGAIDRVAQRAREGVTAWMCGSDYAGYLLCQELSARGLRVPQDVSVTGFDGSPPPMGMTPLTTLRVPFQEMASVALNRLVNRIRHPGAPGRQILLECQLVPGGSTAAAHV
ncbi:MAG TPA: LacI family DNA-binding transcriptional regulator [Tepidisphaeraceae bacterium]|nr:LacI family DNA-binding transcriptional regulator [Tepidisphaeraceae bacterium]